MQKMMAKAPVSIDQHLKYSAIPEVMNIDLVKEHKHRTNPTRQVLGN